MAGTQLCRYASVIADKTGLSGNWVGLILLATATQAYLRYELSALTVIAVGIYLPFAGTQLAEVMGWHNTFVGTLFIAKITSLPELAVSIAALRMGALDMAIANLLGQQLVQHSESALTGSA